MPRCGTQRGWPQASAPWLETSTKQYNARWLARAAKLLEKHWAGQEQPLQELSHLLRNVGCQTTYQIHQALSEVEEQEAGALKAQRDEAMQGFIGWLEASLKGSAGAVHKYTTSLLKPTGPNQQEINDGRAFVQPLELMEAKADNWKTYWNPRHAEPEAAKNWMQLPKSAAQEQLADF